MSEINDDAVRPGVAEGLSSVEDVVVTVDETARPPPEMTFFLSNAGVTISGGSSAQPLILAKQRRGETNTKE